MMNVTKIMGYSDLKLEIIKPKFYICLSVNTLNT